MKKIIMIMSVIMIVLTLSSCVKTDNNINNYASDVQKYKADLFMPNLEDLGDYKGIEYFSRQNNSLFSEYSMQLIVRYEEDVFMKEKERLETAYIYLDEPQMISEHDDIYTIPVVKFSVAGFDFRIAEFEDTFYPQNFGMVGISDDKCEVAYLWIYATDLDYICEADEDKNKKMLEFIDYHFSLK